MRTVKNKSEIQLNYRRAIGQADELERLAGQLASLAAQTGENALQGIGNAWDGDSAGGYCRKGRRIILLMRQHSETLRKTAAVLRNAANSTYRAEMRSIEIANRRKYR